MYVQYFRQFTEWLVIEKKIVGVVWGLSKNKNRNACILEILSFTFTELHFILPVPVDMLRWCNSSLRAKPSLTYATIKIDPP